MTYFSKESAENRQKLPCKPKQKTPAFRSTQSGATGAKGERSDAFRPDTFRSAASWRERELTAGGPRVRAARGHGPAMNAARSAVAGDCRSRQDVAAQPPRTGGEHGGRRRGIVTRMGGDRRRPKRSAGRRLAPVSWPRAPRADLRTRARSPHRGTLNPVTLQVTLTVTM